MDPKIPQTLDEIQGIGPQSMTITQEVATSSYLEAALIGSAAILVLVAFKRSRQKSLLLIAIGFGLILCKYITCLVLFALQPQSSIAHYGSFYISTIGWAVVVAGAASTVRTVRKIPVGVPIMTGRQNLVLRIVSLGLAVAAIVSLSVAYQSASTSLQAEKNYHAAGFVAHVVAHYAIHSNGGWPKSWSDLEAVQYVDDAQLYKWPQDSADLRQRVAIEFGATPQEVVNQSPYDFDAVTTTPGLPSFGCPPDAALHLQRCLKEGSKENADGGAAN